MTTNFQHTRRAVYRIVYPVRERPTFHVAGDGFSVIDCSELGLRYQVPDAHRPEIGTTVSGHIEFRRGTEVAVTGEVIRVENGTVALWFKAQTIPLGEIMNERRYLAASGLPGSDT